MLNDAARSFAREFVLNGSYLPRSIRTWCGVVFAIGVLTFQGPIVDGVMQASATMTDRFVHQMQPVIDDIATPSVPSSAPAP